MTTNVDTAIQYGLTRISDFVDDQLQVTEQSLDESLDLLIIKKIIDNYRKNSEFDDYMDFLDSISDYVDNQSLSMESSNRKLLFP